MWIEGTTLGDLLDRNADPGDATAVVFPDERATYRELTDLTDAFARGLYGLGVRPHDKVGILMPNRLDFVVGLFAAAKLGAVVVPINGRFKTSELSHVVAHGDVKLLLTAAGPAGTVDFPALLAQTFPELAEQDGRDLRLSGAPELRTVVCLDGVRQGFVGREDLDRAGAGVALATVKQLQERVRIRDTALLMYTSGTTAKPKGCLLTHEAIVRHGWNVASHRFFLTAEDAFWDPLPLFHIGGIVPMLGCFSKGAKYCHAGHFDPDQSLRTLEEEGVTVAYPAFETIWLQVLNHPRFGAADLSRMRLIQNIAVPERLAKMEAAMPHVPSVSSFGATECSSNLTLSLPDDPSEVRFNTLGHTVPGMEAKVIDLETGEPAPPDAVGELCFRGYALFDGYYKDEDLTAQVIDAEGWFHSGDLGKMDAEGRFIYTGRLKDMLKVGGENVSALEVEGFLVGHDAIEIVQVVGAPDARYTEVPAAFVQLKPGASLEQDELIRWCVGRIATFKVPRYLRIVDEWPMSGTKIKKFELRERLATELEELGTTEAPRIDAVTA
jgi:fatty-acyl-CoA synthase